MVPNQDLGVRIKYFRNKIGYTQKQLGDKVGLNDSTIRNYELGNRIPDIHKLQDIAEALEVNTYSLLMPDVTNVHGAIHVLFDLESMFGFVPLELDNKIAVSFDPKNENSYYSGNEHVINELQKFLYSWYQTKQCLDNGNIDEEMYETWKEKFPNFSTVTEDGMPIIPAVEEIKRATADEKLQTDYEVYLAAKKWAGEDDIISFEDFAKKHK